METDTGRLSERMECLYHWYVLKLDDAEDKARCLRAEAARADELAEACRKLLAAIAGK